MRILQVAPAFAPHLGGVETVTKQLAIRLLQDGVDVQVVTGDETHTLPETDRIDGVPVRRVRTWPVGSDVRYAPGLGAAVRALEPDIVHVQCYQTLVAPAAMIAAARKRIPYVITFHGGGHSLAWRNRIRSTQLATLRPLLARASVLIATASWEIEHYASILGIDPGRFMLIPNGADVAEFDGHVTQAQGTLFVSLGRAERYKGHHRVIAAMPHVLARIPDAQLWIAGEGAYVTELRSQAERLGILDRVDIRAVADRPIYASRLAGASAAVLLSDFETHPLAAIEAINLGVPVLVADNSGLAELAQRGHAKAVPADADSRVHADALIKLATDPVTRNPVSVLTWDAAAAAHLQMYRAVVQSRRPGGR